MPCQHPQSRIGTSSSGRGVAGCRYGYRRPNLIVIAVVRVPIGKDAHQHDGACDEQNGLGQRLHSRLVSGLVSVSAENGSPPIL